MINQPTVSPFSSALFLFSLLPPSRIPPPLLLLLRFPPTQKALLHFAFSILHFLKSENSWGRHRDWHSLTDRSSSEPTKPKRQRQGGEQEKRTATASLPTLHQLSGSSSAYFLSPLCTLTSTDEQDAFLLIRRKQT